MDTRIKVQSHQRSWWIVHTRPTTGLRHAFSGIPPTQLVDCSYSAYAETCGSVFWNPTNAVGGLFILGLRAHRQPVLGLGMNDPPTALVGFQNAVPQASA